MPMLLRLRGVNEKGQRFTLWLPLFLVYIILLPLLLMLLPFVLLAALVLWPSGKGWLAIEVYLTVFRLLGCLSGLEIDIGSGDGNFFIKLK